MDRTFLASLNKLLSSMKMLKADYCILLPGGSRLMSPHFAEVYEGPAKIADNPPPRVRRHQDIREHLRPLLTGLEAFEHVSVPFESFDPVDLRNTACSFLNHAYGAGNYTTEINREAGVLDVLVGETTRGAAPKVELEPKAEEYRQPFKSPYARGVVLDYARPFLVGKALGDTFTVPFGTILTPWLSRAVSSELSHTFPAGSYEVHNDNRAKLVRVTLKKPADQIGETANA